MSQPAPKPSWKEEVNRKLEAHKSRRGLSVVEQEAPASSHAAVSRRAAQAAARVAARYAQAPSYSEWQADEARAALRKAEAATRAVMEAQAAVHKAFKNLEAVREAESGAFEFAEAPEHTEEATSATPASVASAGVEIPRQDVEVRWEPDFPVRQAEPESAPIAAWDKPAEPEAQMAVDAVETVDAAQPIQANLIQFPRELVATRRMRPRLAEPQAVASADNVQLSIFEVDPSTISIEPEATATEAAAPAPSWSGPEWSGIRLDADPKLNTEPDSRDEASAWHAEIQLAPLENRLMAVAVDAALIVGLATACAYGIASHMQHALPLKTAEVAAAAGLVLIGILYQTFFLLTTLATPGMMYAGVALCTFDDERPTRAQLRERVYALLVSLLPMGLGMAWSVFDEDHLSWHDRLSRTYLREC